MPPPTPPVLRPFLALVLALAVLLPAPVTGRAAEASPSRMGANIQVIPHAAANPPASATHLAAHGPVLIALSLADPGAPFAHVLPSAATSWLAAGQLHPAAAAPLALASAAEGVFVVTPASLTLLRWENARLVATDLPLPPAATRPLSVATLAVLGRRLHLLADSGAWHLDLDSLPGAYTAASDPAAWSALPAPPTPVSTGSILVAQLEQLTLFTPSATHAYDTRGGWLTVPRPVAPFDLASAPAAARYGAAHILFASATTTHSYHVPTATWTSYPAAAASAAMPIAAAPLGDKIILLAPASSATVFSTLEAVPLPTGYNLLDHSVVAAYLLAMVGMSLWFSRRKQDSNDFFRGGNRIPWWVSGMSLFATFASAISLMAMPGKAFVGDWTYFSQSLFALIALPFSLFLLAPLVRRLKIPTANAYLERRFGLAARLIASVIAVFSTSLARQGSVLVLPSIALSTIMGVDVLTCIIVMGLVTLAYTFFGGLEAVVWTDTVQGFIMIGAVVGCLVLAWTRIDLTPSEAWGVLQSSEKLHTFDWDWSLAYPTAWVFLITTVIGTLGGVSSQDYIQRVQCTPDLRQARLAVATQLLVAVPLNLLLFALGTVLFLFFRQHPESLSPAMKLDGIYPFFVAQQLPPGVSGLVVAALLAATMSTISSCNCSVSDIVTQDFYKRFKPDATDRSLLLFGRSATLVSGFAGIGTAIWMATATMGSIWDLATLVTSLIGNGVVGLFTLGLLTRRAHQTGALLGVLSGMTAVWLLQRDGSVTFWLYTAVGTLVTVTVGYLASLVLPGRVPHLAGLTVHTLNEQPGTPAA